jgi:hypothetical protein
LDGPTWVPANWQPGAGLTEEELHPAPVDPILTTPLLENTGQLVLQPTALAQESFRATLGPEDAQRFSQLQKEAALST